MHPCNVVNLEFHDENERPRRVDVDLPELQRSINTDMHECRGRIVIVEDLSKAIIETLGSCLDVDPLFFASHINGPKMDIASSKPSMVMPPSKLRS